MLQKPMVLLSLLLGGVSATAQYYLPENSTWVMGNRTGLHFNGSAPQVISSAISSANEGAASVADASGNLLFYTNGSNIWNAQNQLMPNGSAINGAGTQTVSSTQGALIVPHPGNTDLYYIFSMTSVTNCRLYVNLVDVSLDNNKGDVLTNFALKGRPLRSQLTEKLTAVPACNNTVWVVTRSEGLNAFLAYRINENGLDTVPVVSQVGNYNAVSYAQGVLKSNAAGTQLMACNFTSLSNRFGLELFDFDGTTGTVRNAQVIDDMNVYGGAFSPDGSKIYAQAVTAPGGIYQYDLSNNNPLSTKTFIGTSGQYADMKLSPDGQLYVASALGSPGFNGYKYMARINNPNVAGVSSNYQDTVGNIAFLNAAQTAGALTQGLPNDIVKPFSGEQQSTIVLLDTAICDYDQLNLALALEVPAYITNFVWDNNDTARVRVVTTSGSYTFSYESQCTTQTGVFNITALQLPLVDLKQIGQMLWADSGAVRYEWYYNDSLLQDSNVHTLALQQYGNYKLVVTNAEGCTSAFSIVAERPNSINKLTIADVQLYPNPTATILNIAMPQFVQGHLTMYDVSGAVAKQVSINGQNIVIPVEDLVPGVYTVAIVIDQVVLRKTFVKQ